MRRVSRFLLRVKRNFTCVKQRCLLEMNGGRCELSLLFCRAGLGTCVVVRLGTGRFRPRFVNGLGFCMSTVGRLMHSSRSHPAVNVLLYGKGSSCRIRFSLQSVGGPVKIDACACGRLPRRVQRTLPNLRRLGRRLGRCSHLRWGAVYGVGGPVVSYVLFYLVLLPVRKRRVGATGVSSFLGRVRGCGRNVSSITVSGKRGAICAHHFKRGGLGGGRGNRTFGCHVNSVAGLVATALIRRLIRRNQLDLARALSACFPGVPGTPGVDLARLLGRDDKLNVCVLEGSDLCF